ncbi:MAG: Gfo/Idh/MocA family oxidoreductase [Armatimonadota bacterium]|nr:Gfo/Idh/MocA family oxidoreductase [Armatimonadota bacterium]
MSRLRIGMVGAGTGRGQSWMQTLHKLTRHSELYEFCGFCEVNEEKRLASQRRWGVEGYRTLLELLDGAEPDAVLGAAPPDANPMTLGVCAARGVHVITEIPIAPITTIADWMVRTAREAGIVLEVAEQVWLWAEEQLKRLLIDERCIGQPQHARLYYTNKADYHGINGIRMLVPGEVQRVLGVTGEVRVPRFEHFTGRTLSRDRWDLGVFEFDSDVMCIFESPPRARMSRRWDVEGTRGQLFGESLFIGSTSDFLEFDFVSESIEVEGERVFDHVRVDTDPPVVLENPHREWRADSSDEVARMDLLNGFHAAITDGSDPAYGPGNARRDIEVLFAIRESHRRGGGWLDLPLGEPTDLERDIEEAYRRTYGDWEDPESLVDVPFPQGGVRFELGMWD